MTDLCGNRLLQNHVINTFCEIDLQSHFLPRLTNLPSQRLQCRANGSNVCRVSLQSCRRLRTHSSQKLLGSCLCTLTHSTLTNPRHYHRHTSHTQSRTPHIRESRASGRVPRIIREHLDLDNSRFSWSRDHTLAGPLWEGCRESRRCSKDTYPESYITRYTSIRRYSARRARACRF